jgi:hypothetical protein
MFGRGVIMEKVVKSINQYEEYSENSIVELKVSSDQGETWERRTVNLSNGLEDSGLDPGDIFQFQGEKYAVSNDDDGLRIQPLKKVRPNKRK